jgi:hypothetical protein
MAGEEKTGTREWSDSSANCMNGCAYGCLYCYACANAVRFGRKTAESWTVEEVRKSTIGKRYGKRKGRVMSPTTHDITPGNVEHVLAMLKALLKPWNNVLVTSKPALPVVSRLVAELEPWREQVQFRFTIGTLNPERLAFWEPGAPPVHHRLSSLETAQLAGYRTSVSSEPLLDVTVGDVVKMVDILDPLVTDTIWLGQGNRMQARCRANGHLDGGDTSTRRIQVQAMLDELEAAWTADTLGKLHAALKNHPKVRWKVQVRKALGL